MDDDPIAQREPLTRWQLERLAPQRLARDRCDVGVPGAGEVQVRIARAEGMRLTADQYQELLQKGLSISGPVQLVSGTEKVRVVAFDPSSSAVGSVTVPLEAAPAASKPAEP